MGISYMAIFINTKLQIFGLLLVKQEPVRTLQTYCDNCHTSLRVGTKIFK